MTGSNVPVDLDLADAVAVRLRSVLADQGAPPWLTVWTSQGAVNVSIPAIAVTAFNLRGPATGERSVAALAVESVAELRVATQMLLNALDELIHNQMSEHHPERAL